VLREPDSEALSFLRQPYGTPTRPRYRLDCARQLPHCEDNVKLRREGIFAVGNPHDQLGAKQTIGLISLFIRKIELRGQEGTSGAWTFT